MQLTSGFEFMFGEVNQRTLYAIIMLVTVLLYTGSSYTGIDKGIKVLSSCNAFIFIMIMLFVFIVGPSSFIMDIFVQSIGEYADNFFSRHLYLGVVSNDPYPRWWTIYFFTVWFAWAPITGMFLARLSYGRTIREFILVNMVVPSVFGMLWFSIFGGTAIHMEAVQHLGLADAIHSLGNEGASFAFFNYLPLSRFLVVIFFLTALLSFVTAADSMTSTIAIISSKDSADGSGEAPVSLKIIWGLVMGAIAWAVITFAKIDGFKMTSMIFGIPAAVVVMLQGYCVVKMLRENESPESCKKITQTKD
jgi:choline-glycine betaine transporter